MEVWFLQIFLFPFPHFGANLKISRSEFVSFWGPIELQQLRRKYVVTGLDERWNALDLPDEVDEVDFVVDDSGKQT